MAHVRATPFHCMAHTCAASCNVPRHKRWLPHRLLSFVCLSALGVTYARHAKQPIGTQIAAS